MLGLEGRVGARGTPIPLGVGRVYFRLGEFCQKEPLVKHLINRIWDEDEGVLTFEWVLLVTLLTIGVVSGLAAARDAVIDELGDVAQAMMALDQSYTIDFPLAVTVHTTSASGATDSSFIDATDFVDCARNGLPVGQGAQLDIDS